MTSKQWEFKAKNWTEKSEKLTTTKTYHVFSKTTKNKLTRAPPPVPLPRSGPDEGEKGVSCERLLVSPGAKSAASPETCFSQRYMRFIHWLSRPNNKGSQVPTNTDDDEKEKK